MRPYRVTTLLADGEEAIHEFATKAEALYHAEEQKAVEGFKDLKIWDRDGECHLDPDGNPIPNAPQPATADEVKAAEGAGTAQAGQSTQRPPPAPPPGAQTSD